MKEDNDECTMRLLAVKTYQSGLLVTSRRCPCINEICDAQEPRSKSDRKADARLNARLRIIRKKLCSTSRCKIEPQSLCLILQRSLLELLRGIGNGLLLLGHFSLSSRRNVGLGWLLRRVGATAVGLGNVGFFFLQAGNLLLGLLDVLQD